LPIPTKDWVHEYSLYCCILLIQIKIEW
jgi:hypothetical protein